MSAAESRAYAPPGLVLREKTCLINSLNARGYQYASDFRCSSLPSHPWQQRICFCKAGTVTTPTPTTTTTSAPSWTPMANMTVEPKSKAPSSSTVSCSGRSCSRYNIEYERVCCDRYGLHQPTYLGRGTELMMTYTPNTICYSFLHTTTITEIIYDGETSQCCPEFIHEVEQECSEFIQETFFRRHHLTRRSPIVSLGSHTPERTYINISPLSPECCRAPFRH